MDPEQWQRIQQVYAEAQELPPDERDRYVNEACSGDDNLRAEVLNLLESSVRTKDLVGESAWQVVAHMACSSSDPQAGVRLGPYEIQRIIGEGGMGRVYRATDTRLDRPVAIKVCAAQFSARFRSEARLISALNHPSVCTLYDVGPDYLVMELVEGETLAARIDRSGALPISEAVDVAIQVADALEAAHSAGIVHRDLKPANVMIGPRARVKVLDFGVAKSLSDSGSNGGGSSAVTQTMTGAPTLIAGTPAYMSPEQVRGLPVDARCDAWAFGCLLFEMLTAKRGFSGHTIAEVVNAVLGREPDWSALPVRTGRSLRRLLKACLEKDPGRRVSDISGVRRTLLGVSQRRPGRAFAALTIAAILLLGTAFLAWRFGQRATPTEERLHAVPLTTYPGIQNWPSFSPDGNEIAFSWNGEKEGNFDIYSKRIGGELAQRRTHAVAADTHPAWSPDGRRIAFLRASPPGRLSIIVIPSGGGPEHVAGDVERVGLFERCLAWSPDGKWLTVFDRPASGAAGLWLLSAETGERRRMTNVAVQDAVLDKAPAFSPDGRSLAFARTTGRNAFDVYVLPLSADFTPAGEPRLLRRANDFVAGIAWTPDGRELVLSAGQPGNINLLRMAISHGARAKRINEVDGEILGLSVASRSSRLAFVFSRREMDIHRARLSSDGSRASGSLPLIMSSRLDRFPQYSPDGRKIAFVSLRSGEWQLWLADEDGKAVVQMTAFNSAEVAYPRWSPDGRQIAFVSNAGGRWDAYVISSSGGAPRKLDSAGMQAFGVAWSRNGQWLYFASGESGAKQIWRMPAASGKPQQMTVHGAVSEAGLESYNGAMLYYLGSGGVRAVPTEGGEESDVLRYDINPAPIELAMRGIYFPGSAAAAQGEAELMFFKLPKGPVSPVGIRTGYGFSVSPDARYLVHTVTRNAADLMLVNNFR